MDRELYDVLREHAEFTGQSMSRVVAELVEAVGPAFERMVRMQRAVAAAPAEVLEGLKVSTGEASASVDSALEQAGQEWEKLVQLMEAAEAAGAAQPPRTNRGVR